ncbi:MAG: transporter substrate-binding domain-containing protein, partial [Cyanobacteria bacterium P01_C01_bin.70]
MDRRFFLQAGVSLALTTVVQSCAAASKTNDSSLEISQPLLKKVKEKGYLLVVTEDDYPPFEFLVNGEPTGFDHELLDRLRQQVEFEHCHARRAFSPSRACPQPVSAPNSPGKRYPHIRHW